jgi:hypothetical protein
MINAIARPEFYLYVGRMTIHGKRNGKISIHILKMRHTGDNPNRTFLNWLDTVAIFLDIQDGVSYTSHLKKEVLIKEGREHGAQTGFDGRTLMVT